MSKKIYEVVAYHGDETMNGLYPSMDSAVYHAKLVSGVEGTTSVKVRVWVLDKENGIYRVEESFDQN